MVGVSPIHYLFRTMGRLKTFEVDRALDSVAELFRERDYAHLTMKEIADFLRVSRGTLYHSFAGKHGLLVQVVRRYGAEIRVAGLRDLTSAESPRGALLDVFEVAAAGGAGTCLLLDIALKQRDAELSGILVEAIGDMERRFHAAIERGQVAGEIAASVDSLQTARVLPGLYLGLYVLVRSGTAQEPVLRAVLGHVENLLPAPATPEGA